MCNQRESNRVLPHVRVEVPLLTMQQLQAHLRLMNEALERFDHEADPTHHETACRHAVAAREMVQYLSL
jgi:hypothetical protein